jgi:sugar phosphate isomerase/epimerase
MDTARLSCAHSTFPKLSLKGALAVIADLSFPAVDVCVFTGYDHIPPETVLDDPAVAADEVLAEIESVELVPSDVFAILGSSFEELAPNHPDEQVRAESLRCFQRFVEFAQRLGAPGLTILPGTPFEGIDYADGLALAATELSRRTELAREAGLRLVVEPHIGSIIATPDRALELLERTPGLGLALDYSHFVYQGIDQDEVDRLLPHAHHFHVRQAAPGVVQARTHEGTIDFIRIRDLLLAQGYEGYFAIEYQWEDGWLDFSRVDCLSETAQTRDLLLTPATPMIP